MPITIRDIAKEANVSHTTVSLVLNRRAGRSIPPLTRQRVIDAAAALGYRPNQFARALASGQTYVIEVRGIRLTDPYYVHILMSLQSILAADGYQVITSPFAGLDDAALRQGAVKWPVDGILAVDESEINVDFGNPINAPTAPIICLGAYVSDTLDAVTVDLASGVVAAMGHLRASGRRKIAYLADIFDDITTGQREKAYEASCYSSSQSPSWITCGVATRIAARDAVHDYVRQNGAPDAILCRSDSLAIGALRALFNLGISVPGQTAIIGCNGIEEVEFTNPQISSIEIPVKEMCQSAWQLLKQRIADPAQPRQWVSLMSSLVIRSSSDNHCPSP